jgi:hypothetical protein
MSAIPEGTFTAGTLQNVTKTIEVNTGSISNDGDGAGIDVYENGVVTGYLRLNAARDGWVVKPPTGAEVGIGASEEAILEALASAGHVRVDAVYSNTGDLLLDGSGGTVTMQASDVLMDVSGGGIVMHVDNATGGGISQQFGEALLYNNGARGSHTMTGATTLTMTYTITQDILATITGEYPVFLNLRFGVVNETDPTRDDCYTEARYFISGLNDTTAYGGNQIKRFGNVQTMKSNGLGKPDWMILVQTGTTNVYTIVLEISNFTAADVVNYMAFATIEAAHATWDCAFAISSA